MRTLAKNGNWRNTMETSDKSVLMIIAHENFRDEEFKEPYSILENAGVSVTIASTDTTPAKGTLGASVTPDTTINSVNIEEYDAVLFIGGSGSSVYFNDDTALSIAKDAYNQGKIVGAICIAPSILANAGILKGKRATSFPSEKDSLISKGAEYTGEGITKDGNIITADGPSHAREFGREVLNAIK